MSDTPVSDAPATRSGRRSANFPKTALPPRTVRPVVVVSTFLFSALLPVSAYADPALLAASVGLVGVTMALGWQWLLGGPRPRVPTAILVVAALAGPATVTFTPGDPYLRFVPLVLAGGLLAIFVHQLSRRDGRVRLTESVAITGLGLALLVMGCAVVPLIRTFEGREVLAVACAALAVGSLGDLLAGRAGLHRWQLPVAMLLGGWAALGMSWLAGAPPLANAALLGFLVAAVSHSLRRLLCAQPAITHLYAQVAVAAASVLSVSVITYAFARVLVG